MSDHSFPLDDAYKSGIQVNTNIGADHPTPIQDNICWDAPLDMSDAVIRATSTAATQFHYANTAHLMLCGKLLYQAKETSLNTKKLASCLCSYKMEDVEIWGKYLHKTGCGYGVPQPMRHYYIQLFSEEDSLPLLLGMETLGSPVARIVYQELQHVGDQTFQQITQNMAEQKVKETELITPYLQEIITNLPDGKREQLAAAVSRYQDLIADILQSHHDAMNTLDINEQHLQHNIHTAVNDFYDNIGLTEILD